MSGKRRPDDDLARAMPVNVRVVLPGSDEEFPVDCTYEGLDDEGLAIWQVTATLPVDLYSSSAAGLKVLADSLPPRSTLRFNLDAEDP